ncbi:MAG: methylmalonyl Co-A mutase-associated GTPase MeaB [Candidatus Cloacimonadaceae bacterium]|nr:methylmalonyl Co-A mutase-associated GTPase MeaB [Candidatus Cloacimonadota bacterium]MDD3577674.1 methylmalonyl Co-A mutase-associated GTPase MeaB [Candidatus Cloacimonadota bacterium]
MDKRKPEWTPADAGSEFASRVVKGVSAASSPTKQHAAPRKHWDVDALQKGISEGNRTLLSRAITLVESNSVAHFEEAQELLRRLLPLSGKSIRIGITGVPGAGKSTFIENFGMYLLNLGKKVAVLAIDPSSTISKGSILGDKTRMEQLSRHPMSFIRPSPSSGLLGGVARKTRETMVLCEAAGFDVILIETVGVGQSETTVRSMVDFFLLMQIAGAGDELQGIKKGIIELADLIVVNKADQDNIQRAQLAVREYNNALHYIRYATKSWHTQAVSCSAMNGTGIDEIWSLILQFCEKTKSSGSFEQRRKDQTLQWFETLLAESVLNRFYQNTKTKELLPDLRAQVATGEVPVAYAVSLLLNP